MFENRPTDSRNIARAIAVGGSIGIGVMFAVSIFDDGIVDTYARFRLDAGDRVAIPHGGTGTIVAEPEGPKVLFQSDAGGPPQYVYHDYLEVVNP